MKTVPLFRGRRLVDGTYVEGYFAGFVNDGTIACLSDPKGRVDCGFHCDPSTVEQIGGDLFEENKRLKELLKVAN
jgi:hypothetical protein